LAERVLRHDGQLRVLHLAFDLAGTARLRFEQLLTRATPLSPEDRVEVETVIDAIGPKAAAWLPAKIAIKESMAIALARLWMVSPDRAEILRATGAHLATATDVLRVAVVLMGGDAGLVVGKETPKRLGSLPRGLRRVVLEALDKIPDGALAEEMQRHRGLWKRVGERLHPFEHARRLPTAALAFAVVRGTKVAKVSFGDILRAQADRMPRVRIADDRILVTSWGGAIEDGLRAGDARGIIDQLATRPGELLRRADHLIRVTQARQPEALGAILERIQQATSRGAPATLLTLAGHVAQRGKPWSRRVFFPKSAVLKAWSMPDHRASLRPDAVNSIVTSVQAELVRRAEARSRFARAVIDRGLLDLLVPISERSATKSKIAWPRGSEIPIPQSESLRLFLHWEDAQGTRVDLDLSVALFDASWRHVGTCDFTHLVVGDHAATHSGDLTSAPPPLGASEFVDLHLDRVRDMGARYAVMVVFSYNSIPFDRLPHGFAGLMISPATGMHFDPRAVAQRFDLSGRSVITVPLTIDLETRRLRWLDVHIASHAELHQVGGYRAALAHIGKDFADLASTAARPTLWDIACIHAAARANLVYVRERDGAITQFRRRDGETTVGRLTRLLADLDDDGKLTMISAANAPTWFALLDDTLALPAGSEGYILDARRSDPAVKRLAAADLVAQLTVKP
ncbi:MAG: TerD family protein, partial [Deltaproteobacteria bacterium]|nr:TerD family protein [Deltaproteobacteria bacterium]